MNFLCPACKTPLPVATPVVIACSQCGVEVDLTRVDTAPGQAKLWPEVDLAGETLGTFKLTSRAGSGGMGTVYVAEGLTGRCAVKVLSAQMAADPGLRERFRREAQALRKVQHPGVVHIIDEGTQNGFCWYAMEHVEGKDLRARIAEGPLPHLEVEALARQLLDALAAVHDAQLVHRDLKPGNILLSSTGARLCDFGIARFDGATTLTESAALLGSLRYMAPEQRAGVTTPKSDLYSLGLVLHEAATGGLPGEKDTPGGRLGRLIETLLQASPAKRPADARAAAKLIAPRNLKRVGTLAAIGSSVLGVSIFAAWAVVASQFSPKTTATERRDVSPPSPVVVAKAADPVAVPDAGAGEVAAPALPRTPRVIAAMPEAVGFQPPVIAKLGLRHRDELLGCYENGLKGSPELAGRVVVRAEFLQAGAKGRVPALLRPVVMRGMPAPSKTEEPPSSTSPPPPPPKAPISKKSKAPSKMIESQPADPEPEPQPPTFTLVESTLNDAEVEACVLANVRSWEFPRPTTRRANIVLAWTFEQTTGEALRSEAQVRADAGPLLDPRDPLPVISTKSVLAGTGGKGKPMKKPMPVSRAERMRVRVEGVESAEALQLVDEELAAIGEPQTKQDYLDRKELQRLRSKLTGSK